MPSPDYFPRLMEVVPIDIFGVHVDVAFPAPLGFKQANLEEFGARICDGTKGLNLRVDQIKRAQAEETAVVAEDITAAAGEVGQGAHVKRRVWRAGRVDQRAQREMGAMAEQLAAISCRTPCGRHNSADSAHRQPLLCCR